MNLSLLFILIFAGIGFAVSFTAGFMVGNRITYILFVSFLSTLAFGGLGFGIYSVLEKKVPEFLEFLRGLAGLVSEGGAGSEEFATDRNFSVGDSEFGDESSGIESGMDLDGREKILAGAKSGKFGDHIMVDKIAIKNEPKLMAEAIRTMMAKDDDT
jgi:hypothetical protein